MDGLRAALTGTTSPDAGIRRAAEAQISAMGTTPGFGVALTTLALDAAGTRPGIRQLAAIILRQFVKQRWGAAAASACIDEREKAGIRDKVPALLSAEQTRIRTAGAMVIARISTYDFPAKWPGLLDGLCGMLRKSDQPAAVDGAVRCLLVLAEDINTEQLLQLGPTLLPEMLRLFGTSACGTALRCRAAAVARVCLTGLSYLKGVHKSAIDTLLRGHLPAWLSALAALLSRPLRVRGAGASAGTGAPVAIALQRAALRMLTMLLQNFPNQMKDANATAGVLAATLTLMRRSYYPHFLRLVADPSAADELEDDDDNDDDDGRGGLEVTVIQAIELLRTAVDPNSNKQGGTRKLLRPQLQEVLSLTLAFLQLTAEQVERWEDDPNSFVAADDEEGGAAMAWSLRGAGRDLVGEIIDSFGADGVNAFVAAAQARLGESQDAMRRHQATVSSSSSSSSSSSATATSSSTSLWWQLEEAVLTGIEVASPRLCSATKRARRSGAVGPGDAKAAANAKAAAFVDALVRLLGQQMQLALAGPTPAAGAGAGTGAAAAALPPPLTARGLCCAARLMRTMPPAEAASFTGAALAAIRPTQALPTRIAACRALYHLARLAAADPNKGGRAVLPELVPTLATAIVPVCQVLPACTAMTMHLALETLEALFQVGVPARKTQVAAAAAAAAAGSGGGDRSRAVVAVQGAGVAEMMIPQVLRLWMTHITDPLLSMDLMSVLRTMAGLAKAHIATDAGREIQRVLQAHLIPVIGSVLSQQDKHPSGVVEGSLDLLYILLAQYSPDASDASAPATSGLPPQLSAAVPALLVVAETTADHSVLQSVCECLRCVIRIIDASRLTPIAPKIAAALARAYGFAAGGEGAAPSGLPSSGGMDAVMSDAALLRTAGLLVSLILRLGAALGQAGINTLVSVTMRRLEAAMLPSFKMDHVHAFARLILASGASGAQQVLALLAGVRLPPAAAGAAPRGRTGLDILLTAWAETMPDFYAPWRRKVVLLATVKLLQANDARVHAVTVEGKRLLPTAPDGRRLTRAAARAAAANAGPAPRVPAEAVMLGHLVVALDELRKERARAAARGKSGGGGGGGGGHEFYDDDDSDGDYSDEDETDEDEEAWMASMGGAMGGMGFMGGEGMEDAMMGGGMLLSDMLGDMDDGDEELDGEDGEDWRADPISKDEVVTLDVITQCFAKASAAGGGFVTALMPHLSEAQRGLLMG